ncbi:MAG: methyl-accepting chemotaxis protein [Bacillota bacterium]
MKITIGKKIGFGFIVLLVLLIIIAALSYYTINNIAELAGVVKSTTESSMFITEKEVDHLTWVNELDIYIMIDKEFTGQLDHTKCGFGAWLNSEETKSIHDPQLKKLFGEIGKPHQLLHESAKKIINAKTMGNSHEAMNVYTVETVPSLEHTRSILKQIKTRFSQISIETAGKAAEDMAGSVSSSRIMILILAVISIAAGLATAVFISRQIARSLKAVVNVLVDESDKVASASVQLSAASQQLSEGNSEQAASIEETSATLEETSSMIVMNSENTKQAARLAEETKSNADRSYIEMEDMTTVIKDIKKSSDEISKIVKTIDEIAFQTNILALNAAVEAARAGDAGMGFAVVAEEVRNLALKSAKAAKETEEIVVRNIDLSESGVQTARKVGTTLQDITLQAKKVSELLNEISAASQEQAQGVSQINKAVFQMEKVTQINAANAEESAMAAEQLKEQSDNLKKVVKKLIELVEGEKQR